MASQQQRITGLLDQLATLGAKRTGMPIDADEWNALIDTLRGALEVAAAQDDATSGALDQRYAPTDHSHLAEVTTEWLDADLRANVATGRATPTATGTLGEIRIGAQVGRLLDEVGRVRDTLEDQQARIDRTVAADLDRTSALTDLRTQVTAVNDLRGTVTGLEGQLRTAATQLDGLEAIRSSLTDAAGAPIDVGGLQARVSELDQLRDNLTDGQGNLVRMRDVLTRIGEVEVTAGGAAGGGGLNTRFDDLRTQLDAGLTQRITAAEGRIVITVDERATQLRTDLTALVGNQVDQSATANRAALEQLLGDRVGAAEQRLDQSVVVAVRDATANIRGELTGLARSAVRDGLADVDTRIGAAVDASRTTIAEGLRSELTEVAAAAVDERAGALVAPLTERVSRLVSRIDGLDAAVDASVASAVAAGFDQLTAGVDQRFDARLEEARAALAGSVSDEVGRAVAQQVGDLDARVAGALDARLADIDTRIDRRVVAGTAGLAEQVRTEVGTQIAGLNLTGQLGAVETRVTTALRGEMAQLETRVDSRRSTAVTEIATQLRNENETSRVAFENRVNATLRDRIGGGVILRPNG